MDLANWQEIKGLVQDALELPPDARSAFLDAITDEELRSGVGALLAVPTARANAFDRYQVVPRTAPHLEVPAGSNVVHYTVLRALGRGGMGAVYLAKDDRTEREVALKIIARTSSIGSSEHRVHARLSHPNIATLYESGTTETGLRYVAMEYVEGVPITTFCTERCPTVRDRLELFQKVCAAVAYAHQHLVVHRDLKPGNILVTPAGEPKLLDFGIAKLLLPDAAQATETRFGERPLTLAFASPEQLGNEPTTTASDIYSLGVLLCLMLTGRLPYRVKNAHDLPWAVRNLEPERASDLVQHPEPVDLALLPGPALPEGPLRKLRAELAGDLDAIILRALRKEPDARYQSVSELGEDIRRYLASEPVAARKGTRRYRAGKFIRRHRFGVLASAVGLLVIAGFIVALLLLYGETLEERDRARQEAERAESVSEFLTDMFSIATSGRDYRNKMTVQEVLDNALLTVNVKPPVPEARGTLHRSLGEIYLNLGMYKPAEALLTAALAELRAGSTDEYRLLRAEMLNKLARVHYFHGRYREADAYAQEALDLEQEISGSSSLLATTRTLLGQLAFARGNFREAEAIFSEVLELLSRLHGPDHPVVARAVNDLACALHAQGRYSEAVTLHERAIRIRKATWGEHHPELLQSLHNLMQTQEEQGNLEAAEQLYTSLDNPERQGLAWYDPVLPVILHGNGAALLSRGDFRQAEGLLNESLYVRRALLPDDHPDIARTLAELGRFAHQHREYERAERLYRESLGRLDDTLGPNHPDRMVVTNNLAVLLAETERAAEAEALWRDLLQRVDGQSVPRSLHRALSSNTGVLGNRSYQLEAYERASTRRPVSFRSLSTARLDLSASHELLLPASARPNAEAPHAGTVRFFDDFEDGRIDDEKWEYGGNRITEEQGELRLTVEETDRWGWARTRPIAIDPQRPLVIRRRAKVYAANEYYDGGMFVHITGYPERRFGVSYANYHYKAAGELVTVGFSIHRYSSNPHAFPDRQFNSSPLLPPIWGQWFNEEIVYDPHTGVLRYFLDSSLRLVYNVGPLPPNASTIILDLSTWGWYTGHYHFLDELEVRQ